MTLTEAVGIASILVAGATVISLLVNWRLLRATRVMAEAALAASDAAAKAAEAGTRAVGLARAVIAPTFVVRLDIEAQFSVQMRVRCSDTLIDYGGASVTFCLDGDLPHESRYLSHVWPTERFCRRDIGEEYGWYVLSSGLERPLPLTPDGHLQIDHVNVQFVYSLAGDSELRIPCATIRGV